MTRSQVRAVNDPIDCRWTVEGLPSGDYEARLKVPTGSGGTQQFTVRGSAIDVVIPPAAVRASGQVSVHGKPLANAGLVFWPQLGGVFMSATTDADGRYLVTLDRPDTYRVQLTAKSAATPTEEMEFSAGPNTHDWSIARRPGSVRDIAVPDKGPVIVERDEKVPIP